MHITEIKTPTISFRGTTIFPYFQFLTHLTIKLTLTILLDYKCEVKSHIRQKWKCGAPYNWVEDP